MPQQLNDLAKEILELDGVHVKGKPHGWIQWKGTDVCIDLHCACGERFHFDGDFLYYVQCPGCERVYAVGSNVILHELTLEQAKLVEPKQVDATDEE